MSRRKQARPRLCKREDEDDLTDKDDDQSISEPEAKVLKLSDDTENGGKAVVNGSGTKTETVRCDTCGATFNNLVQFMDHRNLECDGGSSSWKDDDRSDSPLSTDSTSQDIDDTAPGSETMEPVKVPFNLGVDENHPHGCEFCDKAFTKISLLKIHEQVHSDKLPYSCTLCSRRFRHKRSRDRHVKQHMGIKKFKCNRCDASFIRSDHLRSHAKTHENVTPSTSPATGPHMTSQKMDTENLQGDKPKCSKCNTVFETDKHQADHICSSVLAGMKTIVCPFCSAICVGETALSLHIDHAHSLESKEQRKCPICNKNFSNLEDLAVHIKVHDIGFPDHEMGSSKDVGPAEFSSNVLASPGAKGLCPKEFLVCPYCLREDFETLESLEVHMQGVHSVKPTEVYTCNYCNAPYKNLYSLHEHMRAVHQNQPSMGIKYPCSRCGKEYPSIETLQDHKKRAHHSKHLKNLDVIYCTQCLMTFGSTQSLREHMKTVHKQSQVKVKDDQKPTLKTPKYPNNEKEGMDAHTIINVPEPSHLLRHLKTPPSNLLNVNLHSSSGAKAPPSPASKLSPGSTCYRPLSTPPANPDRSTTKLTCDQCNSTFFDMSTYQTHMKFHIDAALGQYACKKCNKLFLTEEELERHLSSHFLSIMTEYGCTSCSKTFGKPDELQKHLMDIHAHHLYRCSLCKEIFDSKVNVQVHFAIKHSNECKLYKCVQCDTIFRSEVEWQVHVRVVHLHMAKPYRCLFCKESFTSEMDLQCHLATHNKPFKCSMCEESFLVEFLLDKHLQSVHSSSMGGSGGPSTASPSSASSSLDNSTPGIKIKSEQSPETVKPAFTLDGSGIYADLVMNEGSLYAGISSSSDGSLVWRSPDDLFRCNICDMKFSKLSGLQTHKIQDHGVKLSTILSQYSPPLAPHTLSPDTKKEARNTDFLKDAVDQDLPDAIPSTSALTEALKSTMLLPVHVPDTQSAFSEKLSSAFNERENLACTFCSQTFKCRADLEKHSKIHLNTGSQKCNICDETFASTGILAEHKLTHCKIQQGNICVICKIALKSEDHFYLHSQEHGFQGAVMQCIVCRQTLASLIELQMHGRHHFQNKSTFHTCCVCLKSFDSNENLVSKLNSTGRTYYVCKPCYHGESSDFTCSQCSSTFSSASQLESHKNTHKRTYQCIKCQESFSSEQEIQIHVTTHMMTEGNAHECHLCFTVLDSPARLQCHLIEHTYRDTDYMCSVCGKIFGGATEIQLHALDHGISARRYGCNQCSQKFFFSAELENHMFTHRYIFADKPMKIKSSTSQSAIGKLLTNQSTAASTPKIKSGAQPLAIPSSSAAEDLKCSECDKTFNNITNLTNHYKQHEKRVKRIQCSHCAETFASVTELQDHFFARHTSTDLDTAKSLYICPTCQDVFAEEENLQEHRKIHDDDKKFPCTQCSRVFTTAKVLANHLKSHSEDKPFQCHVCEKRFSRKENKTKHMKQHHSDDSPFACAVCAKPFKSRGSVKEHMKIHCLQTELEGEETTTEIDTNSGSSEETVASQGGSGVSEEESSDVDSGEQVTSTSNLAETEDK